MGGSSDKKVQRTPAQWRYVWLLVILAGAIVAGIWYASRQPLIDTQKTTIGRGQELVIEEFVLGALQSKDFADAVNPPIVQKPSYTTSDMLVLRVTTAAQIDRLIQINARLLTADGEIVELDPSAIEFAPGTTGFCCWQVDEPGEYTMQIFRPERTITTIPFTVIRGFDQGNVPVFNP